MTLILCSWAGEQQRGGNHGHPYQRSGHGNIVAATWAHAGRFSNTGADFVGHARPK